MGQACMIELNVEKMIMVNKECDTFAHCDGEGCKQSQKDEKRVEVQSMNTLSCVSLCIKLQD